MPESMWGKGPLHIVCGDIYIYTITVEIGIDVTQKTKNSIISFNYTICDYIPKGI